MGLATPASKPRMLRLNRGHWSVENQAFWVRDVVFHEDESTVVNGNIVSLMAGIRGAALTLIRATGRAAQFSWRAR